MGATLGNEDSGTLFVKDLAHTFRILLTVMTLAVVLVGHSNSLVTSVASDVIFFSSRGARD